ncbi:recombinase family protein, partial [bacterium]|nr:recombinase family protein [bacterium]
ETAKALNRDGYKLEKFKQGGGSNGRLEFFTNDNLHHILRNKAYKGIKLYKEAGELLEAKAVWEPIVDARIFDRVGLILEKNYRRKKPHKESRYPYLLSGIIFCKKCGAHLSGKSAHGRNGKVPYYEHGWATRRGVVLSQHLFDCGNPRRFSGWKMEELVNSKVLEILSDRSFSEKLFKKAKELHSGNRGDKELKRLEALLTGYNAQLEAITERIAELPKTISAKSFYTQMEKIEDKRREAESLLLTARQNMALVARTPVAVDDYWQFVKQLKMVFEQGDVQIKEKIIKRLIHKIEVNPEEVTLHMIVDENVVPREPGKKGSRLFLCPKFVKSKVDFTSSSKGADKRETAVEIKKAPSFYLEALNHFFTFGSNTLTIGGGAGS